MGFGESGEREMLTRADNRASHGALTVSLVPVQRLHHPPVQLQPHRLELR